MARYEWLNRIKRMSHRCPSCARGDWVSGDLEPVRLLVDPNSPIDHPELQGRFDGKAVLPVTCKHCGYVATYSVKHLENVSPWE